ncbi:MAG: hypothetical protein HY301_10970 [Verrucomicrobia bacterium]|nr:hypothetical protein [Verrucomicrobiota bacterium]
MKNEINQTPERNDPLDTLLREADGYIPDNGFTARVVAALPQRRRHSWIRLMVLSCGTLASAALAAWLLPSGSALLAAIPRNLTALQWQTAAMLLPILAALGALCWGVFAMMNEEE